MIYRIDMTEQADRDLRNIYEYISFELQSPESAANQIIRLENEIMTLDEMPERFRLYENEPWRSRGLRIMPVDNYCVFYILDKEDAVVVIFSIIYSGRDIETQLGR
jgi:toxin ParE1/3/4